MAMLTDAEKKAIRDKYDLRELIPAKRRHSHPRGYVSDCCINPDHEDTDPSMLLFSDGWVCKGCGDQGDIFKWVMMTQNKSFPEAVAFLRAGNNAAGALPEKKGFTVVPAEQLYFSLDETNRFVLRMTDADYGLLASKTLIGRDTARLHDIGRFADGVFTIPVYEPVNGDCVDVKVYRPKPPAGEKKIWHLRSGALNNLYGLTVIPEDETTFCAIVGGEKDCILGHQWQLPFVTMTGGENSWNKAFNRHLSRFDQVYVVLDADDTGRAGMLKICKAMPRAIPVDWRNLWSPDVPKGYDFADFVAEGNRPEEFLALLDMARKSTHGHRPLKATLANRRIEDVIATL